MKKISITNNSKLGALNFQKLKKSVDHNTRAIGSVSQLNQNKNFIFEKNFNINEIELFLKAKNKLYIEKLKKNKKSKSTKLNFLNANHFNEIIIGPTSEVWASIFNSGKFNLTDEKKNFWFKKLNEAMASFFEKKLIELGIKPIYQLSLHLDEANPHFHLIYSGIPQSYFDNQLETNLKYYKNPLFKERKNFWNLNQELNTLLIDFTKQSLGLDIKLDTLTSTRISGKKYGDLTSYKWRKTQAKERLEKERAQQEAQQKQNTISKNQETPTPISKNQETPELTKELEDTIISIAMGLIAQGYFSSNFILKSLKDFNLPDDVKRELIKKAHLKNAEKTNNKNYETTR